MYPRELLIKSGIKAEKLICPGPYIFENLVMEIGILCKFEEKD